jgi:hypothetical protein
MSENLRLDEYQPAIVARLRGIAIKRKNSTIVQF